MKLYIAASSHPHERQRVNSAFAAAARITGVEIVGDWRPSVDKHGSNPAGLMARDAAEQCLDGVEACDVVWLLLPIEQSRGAWLEAGYALGKGKVVVASGPNPHQSVFCSLFLNVFVWEEQALAVLRRLASTTEHVDGGVA